MNKMLSALIVVLLLTATPALANPPERRPEPKVEFPQIKDWSSLHISMSRIACYGTCPIYTVDIGGDGTVRFNGVRFTTVVGEQTANIPPEAARALFEKFRQAQFFLAVRSLHRRGHRHALV